MSAVHNQSPSVVMTVISANVEGITVSKASILSVMCKEQHYHCLCLQETHRSKDQARFPGMTLVAERPHNKHGSSVFIRDGPKMNLSVCEEEHSELITVELLGVVIHSMYKPPPQPFRLPTLGQRNKPHIVIGDFNSHSTLCGYTTTQRRKICGAMGGLKQPVTHIPISFNSAMWKKWYNPDLIFVFSNISDMLVKSVLDIMPHTQHRPICVTVNAVIVPQPTTST